MTPPKFPSNQIALPHARKTQPLLSTSSGGPAYCVEFRGDWKWQREAFCLTSHWGATNFCHVCVAKGTGNPLSRPLIYAIFDMLTNRFCILHCGLLYIKCSNQITDFSSSIIYVELIVARPLSGGHDSAKRLQGGVLTMQLQTASGPWVPDSPQIGKGLKDHYIFSI